MKTALIYTFSLVGHRQYYAQHFIEALLSLDYQICLVFDLSEANLSFPAVDHYRNHPYVQIENVSNALHASLPVLRKLQDKIEADLTIFLEADNHIQAISNQLFPGNVRLRGRNLGLFIRSTNYVHYPTRSPKILNPLRFIKNLLRNRFSDPSLFHEFLLPRFELLDGALVIDEHFSETHTRIHQWIPDMVFPLLPVDPDLSQKEVNYWAPKLESFLGKNRDREILFYFGTSMVHKGYDILLKLASDTNNCLVHCGLFVPSEEFEYEVDSLRNNLRKRDLLFETNAYIVGDAAIKLFFNSCNFLVMPYNRNFYGASGVMVQAALYGKPVLVADKGLMSLRTEKSQLGLTYRVGDSADLIAKWNILKETYPNYLEALRGFSQQFSTENCQQSLIKILSKYS